MCFQVCDHVLGEGHGMFEQSKSKRGRRRTAGKERAACGGICRLTDGQNDSLKVDLLH